MISKLTILLLIGVCYGGDLSHYNRYSELSTIEDNNYLEEYEKISKFLHKVNEGTRNINYMCESLEEEKGIFNSLEKPICKYNMSYINNTEIYVYSIDESLRIFFQKKKIKFCKEEKIECGELTIILRLLDLINLSTKLTENIDNTRDLWTNLKLIDFDDLYTVYINSLNNPEILSNITLAKQRATLILNKEKERLFGSSKFDSNKKSELLENYISIPFSKVFNYIGTTIGSTLGLIIKSSLAEVLTLIPGEIKYLTIILLLTIIYSKLK